MAGRCGRVRVSSRAKGMCSVCLSSPCACWWNCCRIPGEVVTRERLVEVLWPKGVVDFDNSLNAVVRKLRMVLGDDSERRATSRRCRASGIGSSGRWMCQRVVASRLPRQSRFAA